MEGQLLVFILIFVTTLSYGQTITKCRRLPTDLANVTWDNLNTTLSGRLRIPKSPIQPCLDNKDQEQDKCTKSLEEFGKDPFCVMKYSGGTQSTGQAGAWNASQSTYVVEALYEDDIVKAVKFANYWNLRLVVKGTGHDYNGRSNAANSLLIWTYKMRSIHFHNSFIPNGCTTEFSAVTVGPGLTWVDVYTKATENDRVVVGGACASVGVVGFTIGGGYGILSKIYGLAATNLLEARIITANGDTIVASECSHDDLFYALRGGGFGFGVVTSMTFRTHPIPNNYITIAGYVTGKNGRGFWNLIIKFLNNYKANLPTWASGEIDFIPQEKKMKFKMTAVNLALGEAKYDWQPLFDWFQTSRDIEISPVTWTSIPGKDYFTLNNADAVKSNCSQGFFWKGTDGEVSEYWLSSLNTRYLRYDQFLADTNEGARKLIIFFNKLPQLTRQMPIKIYLYMAQYGVTGWVEQELNKIPLPPSAKDSFGFMLVTFGVEHYSPLVSENLQYGTSNIKNIKKLCEKNNHKKCKKTPNNNILETCENTTQKIEEAMQNFQNGAGSYFNMAAFHQNNFTESFWGEHNYKKLLKIKQKFDPEGLFYCHNCVGSEEWEEGGMCRRN